MPGSQKADQKRQVQEVVQALDKLVDPLDKILLEMKASHRLQKGTAFMAVVALIGVSVIAFYDFTFAARSRERLEERMDQITTANDELRLIADRVAKKVTDTEKKVEQTQETIEKQPEVKMVTGPDGGAPTPVIVIKEQKKKEPKAAEPKAPPSAPATSVPTSTEITLPLKLPEGAVVTSGPDAGSPQAPAKK